jgi:hypothetical protein
MLQWSINTLCKVEIDCYIYILKVEEYCLLEY